jgi:hypothetical protein
MSEQVNRRANRVPNLVAAMERVLDDAEAGDFPIRHRSRDCERLNIHASTLNSLHEAGRVEELRRYMAGMVAAIDFEERREK